MTSENFLSILIIMLCRNCTLGGAEKRYARIFEQLVTQTNQQHKLLINREMLLLLQSAGILTNCEEYLIILDSPFKKRRAHNHALKKLLVQFLEFIWYIWQCERNIRKYKSSILHPLLTGIYFCLLPLILHPKTRYIMSAYSYQFENYRDKRIFGVPIGATIKKYLMNYSQAIDALTQPIYQDLVARNIDKTKIHIAPCSFTDISDCQPKRDKKKWVVFVGRFVDIKNPLLLAQAIPDVLKEIPQTHFYFLGEGNLEKTLTQTIEESNVESNVTIRFEPTPTTILNQSSIFVSLQTEENYPSQSLLEAMACGNAIIATDVGETWKLVDKSNGIRIPLSATALAQAIIQLLNSPHLEEMGHISRERVLSEHNINRFFEYMANVYQNATGKSETQL